MIESNKKPKFHFRLLIIGIVCLCSCAPIDDPVASKPTVATPPQQELSGQSELKSAASAKSVRKIVPHEAALPSSDTATTDPYAKSRAYMVANHMAARDIVNPRVLETMEKIPRHLFVAPELQKWAYDDAPLTIGEGQTISQPYIVALMTQLVDPQPGDKALDIGTGSGYQAAVLAELVKNVYSIEIVESLATKARKRLEAMGYDNIVVQHGDGYRGWKSKAPFDVIIVAAAPDHIPEALVEQLAPGGKLVIPVGSYYQNLIVVEKKPDGKISKREIEGVRFVPMTGEARKKD